MSSCPLDPARYVPIVGSPLGMNSSITVRATPAGFMSYGIRSWLCFFNPLIHLWNRRFRKFKSSPATRLWSTAERPRRWRMPAASSRRHKPRIRRNVHPACATGMAFRDGTPFYHKEDRKNDDQKKINRRRGTAAALVAALEFLMSLAAYASKRTHSGSTCKDGAGGSMQSMRRANGFPIVVNDLVLE